MKGKKISGMKSALELAMEKIDAETGKPPALTEDQKREIEEVEQATKARIAEVEIMSSPRVAAARTAGDMEGAARLEAERASEIGRLRRKAEKQKREVRGRGEASP